MMMMRTMTVRRRRRMSMIIRVGAGVVGVENIEVVVPVVAGVVVVADTPPHTYDSDVL